MNDRKILFSGFEFPVEKGLEYLINDGVAETDFLHINEPGDSFSMTFERDFPIFTVPKSTERDYALFELKREGRVIRFFCPEKRENLDTVVWYFYVDIFDADGKVHTLPGQVRVEYDGNRIRLPGGKPKFVEVLEQVRLRDSY